MNPLIRQPSGRHFLQIPGPTNVPDRVLRAIDAPTIDHRGPEFAVLTKSVLAGLKKVFKTDGSVVLYPASGRAHGRQHSSTRSRQATGC
jgi:alanine-glyoxylate transaminase/serine-glyoxylate transaminase/serine-pyruvate transaminase